MVLGTGSPAIRRSIFSWDGEKRTRDAFTQQQKKKKTTSDLRLGTN